MKRAQIVVGARGSLLSVTQTESVIGILRRSNPGYSFRLEKITTLGDRSKEWGRNDTGIFVKEIEDALLCGKIDIAVHSVKDLPSKIPGKLLLAAVTRREDPRDVLITKSGADMFSLPKGCIIGTSSLRRRAQILHIRPDVRISELRGNLDTRIRKLQDGDYDAIVVAAAGLRRLKIARRVGTPIPPELMLPQTGQGALGIEIRKNDPLAARLVGCLNDPQTRSCVSSERAFLLESKAGCRMPVAAFATVSEQRMSLEGLVISLDGKRMIRLHASSSIGNAAGMGKRLARQVLKNGGAQILREIRNAA
ncbi:MAG: hydroxymethylbilane synthase [Candidatus Omnitrophota bacterium]